MLLQVSNNKPIPPKFLIKSHRKQPDNEIWENWPHVGNHIIVKIKTVYFAEKKTAGFHCQIINLYQNSIYNFCHQLSYFLVGWMLTVQIELCFCFKFKPSKLKVVFFSLCNMRSQEEIPNDVEHFLSFQVDKNRFKMMKILECCHYGQIILTEIMLIGMIRQYWRQI